ncbi:S1C family serine protease [Flavivirga spongiicola]|uniref:Trypsin-like peptidase domain-containing protein n=1 Tax=Flavivirga spongiicola TaxID=421621 RepID=A0ABU7XX59_9FLAO|nr:trypsin-like peptidase domain-containing protein [Flavivirga sp. MEBiC05379]MDO5979546.1 trypsin-like peptidase domain-containing protein [Flavivirga sp. MEBiC05379]
MKKIIILFLICLYITEESNAQDLSDIYERVSPAVVAIYTKENNIVTSPNNVSQTVTNTGLGSGFMISNQLVVTAAHVVRVPDTLVVQFADGETIPAKVITAYESADIALLKLSRQKMNVTTVRFGDSDRMKIGQRVFVIGVPLGLGFSLSSGYISAFKKQFLGKNPFTNTEYIQTDAAINQGNSGGPMFNLDGEVIGIVSHITSKSGGSDGIGYASTSNLAAKLLLNNKMPWFGAELYSLSGNEAKLFNLPQDSGLLVQRIASNSLFDKMGIKEGDVEVTIGLRKLIMGGDIILAFNDITYDVTDYTLLKIADFANSLEKKPEFKMTVLRGGKIITLQSK